MKTQTERRKGQVATNHARRETDIKVNPPSSIRKNQDVKDRPQIKRTPLRTRFMEWIRKLFDLASWSYTKENLSRLFSHLYECRGLIHGLRTDLTAHSNALQATDNAMKTQALEIQKIEAILGLSRVYTGPMEYYLRKNPPRKRLSRRSRAG